MSVFFLEVSNMKRLSFKVCVPESHEIAQVMLYSFIIAIFQFMEGLISIEPNNFIYFPEKRYFYKQKRILNTSSIKLTNPLLICDFFNLYEYQSYPKTKVMLTIFKLRMFRLFIGHWNYTFYCELSTHQCKANSEDFF